MAALDEYLAGALTSIANARLQSDLESIRIAEIYAAHPLLKYLPVPRFRLPGVTLDLPIGLANVDEGSPQATPAQAERGLLQSIDRLFGERKLTIPAGTRTTAVRKLHALLVPLSQPAQRTPAGLSQAIERAVGVAMGLVDRAKAADGDAAKDGIDVQLRNEFAAEMTKLLPTAPRLQVVVVTGQLKDLGPADTLTRIQLRISEEGVEWSQSNPDDSSSRKLVPE